MSCWPSSTLFVLAASSLKRLRYAFKVSKGPCLMLARALTSKLIFLAAMNYLRNEEDSWCHEWMEPDLCFLNHSSAAPIRVMGKTWHLASSDTRYTDISLLNLDKWSAGSVLPS